MPGKFLYTADALSRAPIDQDPSPSEERQSEVECYVNAVMVSLPASDHRLEKIGIELKRDDSLKVVMQYPQHGWPDDKRKLFGPTGRKRKPLGK